MLFRSLRRVGSGYVRIQSVLWNSTWPIRFAGYTEHVLAYFTNQFCSWNRRATETVGSGEDTVTCGSYLFSGSSEASNLDSSCILSWRCCILCVLWKQETPHCRGTTTVDRTKVSTSFMYLKGHCNRFTLSSFLRTSAPRNDLATPICGCFHPSFGLLGPWYTWYELVWGMALV